MFNQKSYLFLIVEMLALKRETEEDGGEVRVREWRAGDDLGYLKSYGSVLEDIWLSNRNLPGKTQYENTKESLVITFSERRAIFSL